MEAAEQGSGVTCGIRLADKQRSCRAFVAVVEACARNPGRDGDKTHICERGFTVRGGAPVRRVAVCQGANQLRPNLAV